MNEDIRELEAKGITDEQLQQDILLLKLLIGRENLQIYN